MMALGAHGLVSVAGNVAPQLVVQLVHLAQNDGFVGARALHYRLKPLFDALFLTTNPIPLKRAAAMLGHARDIVRLPLTSDALDAKMEDTLRSAMIHAGLL